jgi:hypothetical protein
MSTAAPACVERRRSTRLPIPLALTLWSDGLQEETARFERAGRVTRLGHSNAGRTEVGIEFLEPAPDFWLIRVANGPP